ncbi:TPA: hypothetical protein ON086_003057 [Klebsiella aerogenes]|nr:hypothetical protein [Klebsiella aerogenes]
MIDLNAKKIDNPLYKIIMYLNKYEENILQDESLQFLLKNLSTHFRKLFYMIIHINKIQKDEDFITKYNRNGIISISAIEYCYYKISTIWDISYQIADKLVLPRKKHTNKYEYLNQSFEKYSDKFPNLNLAWYKELNSIRNRIVHGGITVNPYYINDINVRNKICFQAYDFRLDDLIQPHWMYTNIYNNNINFADYYFSFYTHILYSYLFDFFDYVLFEMNEQRNHDINNLHLSQVPYEFFERTHKTWSLSEVDVFYNVTTEMIRLELSRGNIKSMNKWSLDEIETFYSKFPFRLLNSIK